LGFDKLGFHLPSLAVFAVNFVLLLAILYFFAYKRLLAMMDRRSERIREGLEAADKAKEDAARSQERMEQQMLESRRESQHLLEQAREASERYRQEERARAQEEVRDFISRARKDIQRERDRAIDEVRRHFAGLAITAAEKVVHRSLDENAHKELIEEVLREGGELPRG
jgi:F-type H+-transporting ATPase subunit b